MEEENKNLVKLMIAILSQAIIDAYIGSRYVKKKTIEWFSSDDYKIVTNLLKQHGIRPQNIFDLPCSWDDIPKKLSKDGELLYIKCKAVNYLEGANSYLLGREVVERRIKKLIKISTRKKKFRDFDAIQLVNLAMI